MEEGGDDSRPWDELMPDALGLIFKNLPLCEILLVLPCVCKSWRNAVAGPYCWQEIDIEEFSTQCNPNNIDPMVKLLVTRSNGNLRKLAASGLGAQDPSIFSFIADHSGNLKTLQIPRSEITNPVMEQIVERISNVTFLDISHCSKIGPTALEAIGGSCKNLEGLSRNMAPFGTHTNAKSDEEAMAIAAAMPKLKRLEMSHHLMGDSSVLEILKNCPELEFLDIRGCWKVGLGDKFFKERFPLVEVVGPTVVGHCPRTGWDDSSDQSEYLAWEFVAGDVGVDYDDDMWDDERELELEEIELRFYEDIDIHGWPPSP